MNKKKLLFVCQYYYPERIGLTDICEDLVQRGYSVTVLTGLPNYPEGKVPKEYKFWKKRNENINGVNVIRCFEIGRHKGLLMRILNYVSFYISSMAKVKKLDKDFECVICYQHSPITMASAALKYKRINNKKMYLYCFDLWPESLKVYNIRENNIIFRFIYKLSNKIYKNCDKIIVSSKPFIQYFTNVHEININKLFYVPQHSIDFGKNLIPNAKKDNKIHLLFAGNIGKMQNIECIIYAINELNNKSNLIVDIVGYGSEYENLVNLTDKLKLNDIILFHGRKDSEEMNLFYSVADAFLITLKDDSIVSQTLPLKMQSYLSVGKPILGCINGAASEMIKELKCGECCSANDYKEYSKIISKFLDGKIKYDKQIKFTLKDNVDKIINILEI